MDLHHFQNKRSNRFQLLKQSRRSKKCDTRILVRVIYNSLANHLFPLCRPARPGINQRDALRIASAAAGPWQIVPDVNRLIHERKGGTICAIRSTKMQRNAKAGTGWSIADHSPLPNSFTTASDDPRCRFVFHVWPWHRLAVSKSRRRLRNREKTMHPNEFVVREFVHFSLMWTSFERRPNGEDTRAAIMALCYFFLLSVALLSQGFLVLTLETTPIVSYCRFAVCLWNGGGSWRKSHNSDACFIHVFHFAASKWKMEWKEQYRSEAVNLFSPLWIVARSQSADSTIEINFRCVSSSRTSIFSDARLTFKTRFIFNVAALVLILR